MAKHFDLVIRCRSGAAEGSYLEIRDELDKAFEIKN